MNDAQVLVGVLVGVFALFGGAVWFVEVGSRKMNELREAAGALNWIRAWKVLVLGGLGIVIGGIGACQLGDQHLRNQREALRVKAGVSPIEVECANAVSEAKTTRYQRDICLAWLRRGPEQVVEARTQ